MLRQNNPQVLHYKTLRQNSYVSDLKQLEKGRGIYMSSRSCYTEKFYAQRYNKTIYSANVIMDIVINRYPSIKSAIDIGCGVGTWLSVLQDKGVEEIYGVDGCWIDDDLLVIPKECFKPVDLNNVNIIGATDKKYDIAISLEVAEHLEPDCSEQFITLLSNLSDLILFSAAIPYQEGINHINLQWQSYWERLFNLKGYEVYDLIRPKIWNDDKIQFWYKQNILLFSKSTKNSSETSSFKNNQKMFALDIVHPELYLRKAKPKSVRENLKALLVSVKRYLLKISLRGIKR